MSTADTTGDNGTDRPTAGAASSDAAPSTAPDPNSMAAVLHLYRIGELDEAEARCHAIVERDPGCGAAWDRLARIAERRGQQANAEDHYRRAVAVLAEPAEAHNNLAVLLQRRGDLDGALTHYRQAAALGLRHALLHSNLGCLLRDLGRLQEGVDEFARAMAIDDESAFAHSDVGVTLALQGEMALALSHLRRAVALQPDWDLAHSNLLFCLNYADDLSPDEVAAQHRAFGRRHPEPEAPPLHIERAGDGGSDFAADADPERKLRVGFVSPDLKQHSVAYFLEPILSAYDRDALEIVCYSDAIRPDAVSDRMRAAVDRWRSIRGVQAPDVAQLVRADRIDILIDLAGHTANNRMSLFATRVAPVQMTYLGYPNTTGLDTVDWRLTDAWADPPGMTEALHSEELLRITGGFLCFRPRADGPDPAPTPMRAQGHVTFGSFNLPAKISPTAIALWAQILDRVPGARLCLKGPAFADPPTRAAYERRLATSPLAGHDVQLWSHLADERNHLAAYGRIDIALDTWPYGGTTTTCEALWMGVPVVTMAGRAHATRVGASLLSRIGEPALIAGDPAGYVAAAVALAGAPERLDALRSSLRGRMVAAGITDAATFTGHFTEALRRAWRQHCHRVRAARQPLPAASTTAPLGNLQVVVPDTLAQVTTYVLAEQHDWFEDEIGFVRAALRRGERAVDIGAKHGVYAISIGRRVGVSGRVWAFEPARAVAERLRASLAINGLPQVEVVSPAVADPAALDECRARLGLRDVAFVRIDADADAAAAAILDGGRRFFVEESPLVMFAVKQAANQAGTREAGLVTRFEELGYRAYRLIPGLEILAPFDAQRASDPFTQNLFACRADRAEQLERRGLLTRTPAPAEPADDVPAGTWLPYLRAQLFAAPLWPRWSSWAVGDRPATAPERAAARALDHYAVARRITEPPPRRHAALMAALRIATPPGGAAPVPLSTWQTLARVAFEAGERTLAVEALNRILERCAAVTDASTDAVIEAELSTPFLAVSPRFDEIAPPDGTAELLRWMTAAALEQRERSRALSSFYTARDPATRACLEEIARLGYQSPEMARRLELIGRQSR